MLRLYHDMLLIRRFEETVERLFSEGRITGTAHTCIGQEAVAVGVAAALGPDDAMTSTHRGHGHLLARGGDPVRLLAELFGEESGYSGGRGGSQMMMVPELGVYGTNGITGASVAFAAGLALKAKMAGEGRVVAAFLGDGASSQGIVHETMNLASLWKLPVVFVCEANGYAMSTPTARGVSVASLADRARAGYAMEAESVDGNDVIAVRDAMARLVAHARAGNGPAFLECRTDRLSGHSRGDQRVYRTREEEAEARLRDPIELCGGEILRCGAGAAEALAAIDAEVATAIEAAVSNAECRMQNAECAAEPANNLAQSPQSPQSLAEPAAAAEPANCLTQRRGDAESAFGAGHESLRCAAGCLRQPSGSCPPPSHASMDAAGHYPAMPCIAAALPPDTKTPLNVTKPLTPHFSSSTNPSSLTPNPSPARAGGPSIIYYPLSIICYLPRSLTGATALRSSLSAALAADPRTFIIGEDIGVYGGSFGVTRGLIDEFGPERVRDTPISEAAITGVAIGAAVAGARPIVEIMFMDFMTLCVDPLVNMAAKLKGIYGLDCPLVIRSAMGAGRSYGATHSQCLERLFAGIPGLKVVAGSTGPECAGLLLGALADPGPVLVLEHKLIYPMRFEGGDKVSPIPPGSARIAREGTDVTIVAWSYMVHEALRAAEALAEEEIEAEVVDLRSIAPIDAETLAASAAKTGRVLVVEEGPVTGGVSAEVACAITERTTLAAPVRRLGMPEGPIPAARHLEKAAMPDAEKIADAARDLATLV